MRIYFNLFMLILGQSCLCVQRYNSKRKCAVMQKRSLLSTSYHDRVGIKRAARSWDFFPSSVEDHAYYAGLIITIHSIKLESLNASSPKSESVCGATLISANRLVTAAHCWRDHRYQGSSLRAILGSWTLQGNGGVSFETNKVVMHPGYDPHNYLKVYYCGMDHKLFYCECDALIFSSLPYFPGCQPDWSKDDKCEHIGRINPIAMPSYYDLLAKLLGTKGTVVGFADSSDSARVDLNSIRYEANVIFVQQKECRETYGDVISTSHLCTAGVPAELRDPCVCAGDSGGPLVAIINNRQVYLGVAIMSNRIGCPRNSEAVYTRVRFFLDFIFGNID